LSRRFYQLSNALFFEPQIQFLSKIQTVKVSSMVRSSSRQ
jgi:hypothetical protein